MAVASKQLEISCESCGAKILFEPLLRTARCPYCDSPSVVDRPATHDRPDPVFALGFRIDRTSARNRMRRWLAGKRWGPAGLRTASAEQIRGVYLPCYLFSATASSSYRAVIAEVYYKTTVERDSRGRTSVKRRRKIEHRNLEGRHSSYLGDVLVTASRGVPNDEVEAIEPFDLGALRRYTPALISGWLSEEPSTTKADCLELARSESRSAVGKLLRRFMPGDGCHDLSFETDLSDEAIDLVLVPGWVFAVRYHREKPPVRILVNGQGGKVFGKIPFSWAKVGIVAAVVAAVVALIGLFELILGLFQ
jgi:DNA-directed RNA polymerase subunit RPC12/RpoP